MWETIANAVTNLSTTGVDDNSRYLLIDTITLELVYARLEKL